MATSIQDVAREAGVSISTVSRSFTRPDLVSAKTRERVLAIAALATAAERFARVAGGERVGHGRFSLAGSRAWLIRIRRGHAAPAAVRRPAADGK